MARVDRTARSAWRFRLSCRATIFQSCDFEARTCPTPAPGPLSGLSRETAFRCRLYAQSEAARQHGLGERHLPGLCRGQSAGSNGCNVCQKIGGCVKRRSRPAPGSSSWVTTAGQGSPRPQLPEGIPRTTAAAAPGRPVSRLRAGVAAWCRCSPFFQGSGCVHRSRQAAIAQKRSGAAGPVPSRQEGVARLLLRAGSG